MVSDKFDHMLDDKNRALIPPRFRRELKDEAVLTPGIEKCITAYPLSEQKKLAICNFLVSMRFNGSRLENTVR